MSLKQIITIIGLASILSLVSCDQEPSEDVSAIDMNREGREIILVVTVYNSLSELNDVRKEISKVEDDVIGLSQWNAEGTGTKDFCKIYVITLKSAIDRKQMETWGHELAHCLYGSYHE